MAEDVAHLNRHVSVSKDLNANAAGNPIYVHVVNQSEVTGALNTERLALQSALDSALQDVQDELAVTIEASLTAIEASIVSLESAGDANSAAEIAELQATKAALLAALASLEAANDLSGDDIVAAIQALELSNETDFAATISAINSANTDIVAAIQALEAANDLSGDDIVTAINAAKVSMDAAFVTLEAEVDSIGIDIVNSVNAGATTVDGALQDVENLIQLEMDQSQVILSNILTQLEALPNDAHDFARLKAKQYLDTNEYQYDIPVVLINADIYLGEAPDGTSTADPVWTIIRTYFDANGNPYRDRIRKNVAWDSRTVGW